MIHSLARSALALLDDMKPAEIYGWRAGICMALRQRKVTIAFRRVSGRVRLEVDRTNYKGYYPDVYELPADLQALASSILDGPNHEIRRFEPTCDRQDTQRRA